MTMTRFLQIQALTVRALAMLGRTGKQAAIARKQRADFYRDAWQEAAEILGATVLPLTTDVLQIRREDSVTQVYLNYTPLDDPVSLRVAGNKPVVHQMLQKHGVPIPAFREFTLNSLSTAGEFLNNFEQCVVKPASGTGGGQGVTTGVTSKRELRKSAVNAAGYGSGLMIEQQLKGSNLRLLFLDGELLDAVERRPPTVTGNGQSTIGKLVHELNRDRARRGKSVAQSVVKPDGDMRQTLLSQGLTLRTVPDAGQAVQLKTVINDNAADDNTNVTDDLHPDIVAVARQAVAAVGLRLAGVDVVTPSTDQSLDRSGGVVLEVNSTPGLYFHYANAAGRTMVAVPILAACLGCDVAPSSWKAGGSSLAIAPTAVIAGSES